MVTRRGETSSRSGRVGRVCTFGPASDRSLRISGLAETILESVGILGAFAAPDKRHPADCEPRLDAQPLHRLGFGVIEPAPLSEVAANQ
jgi:hypothetical protein